MVNCRSFLFVYRPLFAMGFAIAGIVTMAVFIGLSLRVQS